jgi:hypothetical protein
VRSGTLAFSMLVFAVACSSPTPAATSEPNAPVPVPSLIGTLSIHVDTGVLVAGRQLTVLVLGVDASGAPIDVSNTELTTANPSVAQLIRAIPIPVTQPPGTPVYGLSATFNLISAGTTAIHARLGIFSDSAVISVIPPT